MDVSQKSLHFRDQTASVFGKFVSTSTFVFIPKVPQTGGPCAYIANRDESCAHFFFCFDGPLSPSPTAMAALACAARATAFHVPACLTRSGRAARLGLPVRPALVDPRHRDTHDDLDVQRGQPPGRGRAMQRVAVQPRHYCNIVAQRHPCRVLSPLRLTCDVLLRVYGGVPATSSGRRRPGFPVLAARREGAKGPPKALTVPVSLAPRLAALASL